MTRYDHSLAVLLPGFELLPQDVGDAVRRAPVVRPAAGSPLHGDDLAAAPFEVSTYAHDQLAHATDLLDSWLPDIAASDVGDGPLDVDPQIWAATLQDALVTAATALWVLSPAERAVRITHRLDLALRQHLELGRVQRFAGVSSQQADEDVRRVIHVARAQGLRVTGCLPIRAVLDAAADHSTARNQLAAVYALLDAAANGDPDAVDSLSRIPVRLPRSSSPDTFDPSPSLGIRVALAAITSVVIDGETLYDAGRVAPR